jgi:hypothetical protein
MFRTLLSRNREPREQVFWRWFAENSAAYMQFEPGAANQETVLNQLGKQLERVDRHLKFEIGLKPDGQGRELVISADGRQEAFPAVQALVAAAPPLPDWQITAFRQRQNLDDVMLQIDGVDYSPDSLWFHLRPEGGVIGVELYLEGVSDPTSQAALMVCFLMLDIALGEYDVETRVGTIEPRCAPPQPEVQGLKPFRTFAEEFDALFTLMNGSR